MSRQRTGRRSTRALNARLDLELDGDLIAWLDRLPAGRRSEAIRTLMRSGLRMEDLRGEFEGIIRAAIREALSGIQIVAAQQGIEFSSNEVEEAFGAQLDKLLDSIS
jgi:hypothetical protein